MSASWRASIPCNRDDAEAQMMADPSGFSDDPPTLVANEADGRADPTSTGSWELIAYFTGNPAQATLDALRAQMPSAANQQWTVENLEPGTDWVALSQAGLAPIRVGRFHVHTAETPPDPDPAIRNLRVPASLAFGTGHHETTRGCLTVLERIKRRGSVARDVLDLGTGTGLLAFAANHLWPSARVTASDIDPVCVPVVLENAAANGFRIGAAPGCVAMVVADGLDDPVLAQRAPYDLIIANILAGPLITLAPAIASAITPGGQLVLSGLLTTQINAVARAYRREGFRLVETLCDGDWAVLHLRRRGWSWGKLP